MRPSRMRSVMGTPTLFLAVRASNVRTQPDNHDDDLRGGILRGGHLHGLFYGLEEILLYLVIVTLLVAARTHSRKRKKRSFEV